MQSFKIKKLFALIIIIGATMFVVVQYSDVLEPDPGPNVSWVPTDNISCHYIEAGNVLSPAEDPTFSPPSKSIFFHETSCRGDLNSRQACAVESAARAHPDWQLHVLFSAPITRSTMSRGSLGVLKKFQNVKLLRVHIDRYAKGTPLESVVVGGALSRSKFRVEHSSDVLRYLTLYKWCGIYLDLDFVMVKNLEKLGANWAAREKTMIASGIMSMSGDKVGRAVADGAAREIGAHFRGDVWGNNGPKVITTVYKNICTNMTTVDFCREFRIYGPEYFYPIHWQKGKEYFTAGKTIPRLRNTYGYHVWNGRTKDLKVPTDSPYAKLAKEFCPSIYTLYGDLFGQ